MNETLYNKLIRSGFQKFIAQAFKKVDRENFVLSEYKDMAYEDMALPIGFGQTISQPTTIAIMLTLLELEIGVDEKLKILEVGCGSGYVLCLLDAILDRAEIYGTERIEELHDLSRIRNKSERVHVFFTPDTLGLLKEAPFDRIIVSAAADEFPQELLDQLDEDNGIIVCPVKNDIIKIKKINDKLEESIQPGFVFVPLVY